jgi:hypothetical protein
LELLLHFVNDGSEVTLAGCSVILRGLLISENAYLILCPERGKLRNPDSLKLFLDVKLSFERLVKLEI